MESNILVTLHDGKPVIKVIDFGVAKAINQQLTEKTLFTAFGQMVGTPQYMSPEQAEISGLDVDTRSDVYSLGVLLYELLTSSTPLEAEQLRDVGYAEIQRLIKESDPLKPSTRLSTAGEKLTAIAQHRSVSPERLSALMRGDLDWVVMKALEKDRNRRYATPNDLGDDVGRYLAKEPVEAYPPSTAYRMRKFVKRNRNLVVGATAFTLMLVVLTIVAMSGWVSAMRQARVARDALYEQAIVAAMLGDKDAAEEAIANAEKAGVPAAKVDVARGLLAMSVGEYDDAAEKARKILNEDPDHISAQALLTIAAFWSGNVDDWSREFKKLKDFEPKTDVDRLITAHTVQFGDSERAVELLGQGRLKHSPIGLLITTIDRAVRSEENQRISEMVGVVEDYRYVKFLMPENKGVMAWRAAALAEAIATHHARGKNAEALELDGRKLLDQFPDDDESPFFNHARWGLCRVLGEEKGAAKALRLAGKSGAFCFLMASELIRQHKSLEAFDNAIVRDKDKYVRISRALLMDDPAAASEEIHRLWEEDKSSMNEFTCLFSIYALSLAGDVDGIRTLANNDLVPGRKNRFETRLCLDFFADPTPSMQAKLEQAVVDRGYATSNAYLTVAMWNLANGRRDRALEYLEKSSKVIVVGHLGNELARSLYQRMKNDDDFPKQLDLKSDRK